MDSKEAKSRFFQAKYQGNGAICAMIRKVFPAKKESDTHRRFSRDWPVEKADDVAGWIVKDAVWQAYCESRIQVRTAYRRTRTIYEYFSELSAQDVGGLSAILVRPFRELREIETRLPGEHGAGDNESGIRAMVVHWAMRHGEMVGKLFDTARGLRVRRACVQMVPPPLFAMALGLSPYVAALVSRYSLDLQAIGPPALLSVGLLFQLGLGGLDRVRTCHKLEKLRCDYESKASELTAETGALIAGRHGELVGLLKDCLAYAGSSEALYHDPSNLARWVVIQGRWLQFAEQVAQRLKANGRWFEIHGEFAFELFTEAYTTGNYRDHYLGQGFPVRSFPLKHLKILWWCALLGFAGLAGWHSGLGSLLHHSLGNPAGLIPLESLGAFIFSCAMAAAGASKITAACDRLVDDDDNKRYIEGAFGQLKDEDAEDLQAGLLMKLAELQAAWKKKFDDTTRGR